MTREFITAGLTLLAIGFGIWLSLRGRPLHLLLSAIHKLLAVGTAVFAALLLFGGSGFGALAPVKQVAGIAAFIALAALFVSGAVLTGKERKKGLMWVHGVESVVVAIAIITLLAI